METALEAKIRLEDEMRREGGLPWPFLHSTKYGLLKVKLYVTKADQEVLFGTMSSKGGSPFNGAAWIPMDDTKRADQGYFGLEVIWLRVPMKIEIVGDELQFTPTTEGIQKTLATATQIHSKAQLLD